MGPPEGGEGELLLKLNQWIRIFGLFFAECIIFQLKNVEKHRKQ